jgi:hypothetical protein
MSSDNSLIIFKTISNFINDLGEVFILNHRPLRLYVHLINKTTLCHETPIKKHIDTFREFCIANREQISNRNIELVKEKIVYSKRVFINLKEIFDIADKETTDVIWMHLLTISALVDPAGKAREILKEQSAKGGDDSGEIDFLTDIISKVEANVDPNSNPMEAVTSIMKSGIFTDLVSGMGSGLQDGSLDLGKLMNTVQKMVTKLSDNAGDHEGGEQAVNMINTMMSSLTAGSKAPSNDGTAQPMPDIAGMLGPMMAMMSDSKAQSKDGTTQPMPDIAGMLGPMMAMMSESSQSKDGKAQPMPDIAGMLGPMIAMMSGNGGGGMPNLNNMMEGNKKKKNKVRLLKE